MSTLKRQLMDERFLARLASAKYDMHSYLSFQWEEKFEEIMEIMQQHISNESNFYPPSCLADVFNSVAGAIYVDSGFDIDVVCNVYFKILQPHSGKRMNVFFIFTTKTSI